MELQDSLFGFEMELERRTQLSLFSLLQTEGRIQGVSFHGRTTYESCKGIIDAYVEFRGGFVDLVLDQLGRDYEEVEENPLFLEGLLLDRSIPLETLGQLGDSLHIYVKAHKELYENVLSRHAETNSCVTAIQLRYETIGKYLSAMTPIAEASRIFCDAMASAGLLESDLTGGIFEGDCEEGPRDFSTEVLAHKLRTQHRASFAYEIFGKKFLSSQIGADNASWVYGLAGENNDV